MEQNIYKKLHTILKKIENEIMDPERIESTEQISAKFMDLFKHHDSGINGDLKNDLYAVGYYYVKNMHDKEAFKAKNVPIVARCLNNDTYEYDIARNAVEKVFLVELAEMMNYAYDGYSLRSILRCLKKLYDHHIAASGDNSYELIVTLVLNRLLSRLRRGFTMKFNDLCHFEDLLGERELLAVQNFKDTPYFIEVDSKVEQFFAKYLSKENHTHVQALDQLYNDFNQSRDECIKDFKDDYEEMKR